VKFLLIFKNKLYFWGTIDNMPNYYQIAKEVETETEWGPDSLVNPVQVIGGILVNHLNKMTSPQTLLWRGVLFL